ncbi:MAG TPA: cytidylate kinase-like family protein [Bryobacteraceae bacterium]|nr:cytidylate kinase-like family protein [Bryobacteraceae bacterium]
MTVIRVVTIEREYGSGAAAIATAVAGELGWKLWDREITGEIARRMKCSQKTVERLEEKPDPVYQRLFRVFMRGSYETTAGDQQPEVLNAETLASLFERIIGDIAAQGHCVIVGRGAPYFMRNREDTYRVFLYASREEKVRRTIAAGKRQSEAEDLVDNVDRERAAFVRRYYNSDWPARHVYHQMINTAMGDALVVKTILDGIDLLNICERRRRPA